MTERWTDGERTISWQTHRRASVAEGEEKTGVGEGGGREGEAVTSAVTLGDISPAKWGTGVKTPHFSDANIRSV